VFLTIRRGTCVAALLTALLLAACSPTSQTGVQAASLKPENKRNPAPGFTLKDANGTTVSLADYKGKVVLLNFWATWCGPCKIEIPWFIEFEQQYKDRGFSVLGVAMDEEGWDIVRPYITEKRVNYRVLMGNDQVAQLYGGVESLPTTFLLDREGRIASTHIGLISKGDYKNEILQLLDGSKRSSSTPIGSLAGFWARTR
jgi:cytochrome c biogenesis protein CcmG/thiol:disulfide interchange protein DsbE